MGSDRIGLFGVGLVIIVFTNTELFTSNSIYLTVSSAEGRTSWRQAALLWISCYFGNLAGALLLVALLIGAGSLGQLPPDHALFDGALHKAQQAGSVIFFKGILANWIVCLAVRVALRCKEEVAKILVLVLIVFIFVYLGFEHSIANMGTFSMAILGGGTLTLGEALHNLLYSTAETWLEGLFVRLPFTYLNPGEREEQLVVSPSASKKPAPDLIRGVQQFPACRSLHGLSCGGCFVGRRQTG